LGCRIEPFDLYRVVMILMAVLLALLLGRIGV